MEDRLRKLVAETILQVFETMFFTFLTPLPEAPASEEWPQKGRYIKASISFSGSDCGQCGEIAIHLPMALARNITSNFLGVEDAAISTAKVIDVAKETANMAIGSLLGKLDPEGKCTLQIPEAAEVDAGEMVSELKSSETLCAFSTENGLLLVQIDMHDEG